MHDSLSLESIMENTLFEEVAEEIVKPFYNYSNFRKAREGEVIYQINQSSNYVYLVIFGEVKIKFSESKKYINKCKFDFFGEYEVIKNTDRVSSAVADTDCLLYKLSKETVSVLSSKSTFIAMKLQDVDDPNYFENYTFINPDTYKPEEDEEIKGVLNEIEEEENKFEVATEEQLEEIVQKNLEFHTLKKTLEETTKVKDNPFIKKTLLDDEEDEDDWHITIE